MTQLKYISNKLAFEFVSIYQPRFILVLSTFLPTAGKYRNCVAKQRGVNNHMQDLKGKKKYKQKIKVMSRLHFSQILMTMHFLTLG